MTALSTAELNTLDIIADPNRCDAMPRGHLEKLYRLDLIEPCPSGVCLSAKGQQIVFKK